MQNCSRRSVESSSSISISSNSRLTTARWELMLGKMPRPRLQVPSLMKVWQIRQNASRDGLWVCVWECVRAVMWKCDMLTEDQRNWGKRRAWQDSEGREDRRAGGRNQQTDHAEIKKIEQLHRLMETPTHNAHMKIISACF